MKPLLTLLLILFANQLVHGQSYAVDFEPSKFTMFESNELKFDQIKTDSSYLYWKCMSATSLSRKGQGYLVAEFGDKKYARLTQRKYGSWGFLSGGGPVFSYNFIVAVKKDKTIEMIDSDEQFKVFIGKVDNIEEVKILAKVNRLSINTKHANTGSYRKMGDYYLLYLFDYMQSCMPSGGEDHQSVKASLSSAGNFTLIDRVFYNKK